MTVTPAWPGPLGEELERYQAWLDDGHEGDLEAYREWYYDNTPAEYGGAA